MHWLPLALACLVAAGAGCIGTSVEVCADGRVCPPGAVCDDANDRCLRDGQVAACDGLAEGSACEFAGGSGECVAGACMLVVCGDGRVGGTEFCEEEAPAGFSCFDFGYERGVLGCSSCTPDVSACHRVGFFKVPTPTTWSLRGVWGTGDVAWAVGDSGVILYWDGLGWRAEDRLDDGLPTGEGLTAVWGRSESDVYAVGIDGLVLHFDGALWREIERPANVILFGAWMAEDGPLLVVGGSGLTAQSFSYDGTSWTALEVPANAALQAVWGNSRSDVYAVARDGSIQHFDGETWQEVRGAQAGTSLVSVWGRGVDEVYAAGYATAIGRSPLLLRYGDGDGVVDGSDGWEPVTPGFLTSGLAAVWGSDEHVVVAGSAGQMAYLSQGSWRSFERASTAELLGGFSLAPGNDLVVGSAGTALRGDGSIYAEDPSRPDRALVAVSATGAGEAFGIVSQDTRDELWGYRAGEWQQVAVTLPGSLDYLTSLWVSSSKQVFIAGNSALGVPTVVRVVGTNVDSLPDLPESITSVEGIWGVAADDLWVIGHGVVGHFDGASWTAHVLDATGTLNDIWGSGASDIYVVGIVDRASAVYHFDGSSWSQRDHPPMTNARAVWGTGPNNVWVGGDSLLHFDGAAWTAVPEAGREIVAIGGTSASDVFVSGLSDTMSYFDGARWQRVSVSATATSIAGSGHDVWLASAADLEHLIWAVPWRCALGASGTCP